MLKLALFAWITLFCLIVQPVSTNTTITRNEIGSLLRLCQETQPTEALTDADGYILHLPGRFHQVHRYDVATGEDDVIDLGFSVQFAFSVGGDWIASLSRLTGPEETTTGVDPSIYETPAYLNVFDTDGLLLHTLDWSDAWTRSYGLLSNGNLVAGIGGYQTTLLGLTQIAFG